MPTSTLKDQTVLVTGGTGLTGSHMVEGLLKEHARVIVSYRHTPKHSYLKTEKLDKKITLVPCDITDFAAVSALFASHRIDFVVHFAAQGSIPSPDHMIELMQNNVMGTTHLLEASRRSGTLKGFIMVSSDKAYGKKNATYVETDPVGGDHPYEVSKAAGDLLARAYNKTFGLPVIVVRAGNIYGPGDLNLNRIVPSLVKTAITHEPLHLRSDGTFVRDYIYVSDVIRAYIILLKHFSSHVGEIFHVSSDRSYSVLELIKEAEFALHQPIPYTVQNSAVNEIPTQHIESTKMKHLGWKPNVSLSEGIKKTFAWYKTNIF